MTFGQKRRKPHVGTRGFRVQAEEQPNRENQDLQ